MKLQDEVAVKQFLLTCNGRMVASCSGVFSCYCDSQIPITELHNLCLFDGPDDNVGTVTLKICSGIQVGRSGSGGACWSVMRK